MRDERRYAYGLQVVAGDAVILIGFRDGVEWHIVYTEVPVNEQS